MRLKNSGLAAATAAAMLFSTAMVGTAVAGTDANVQCAGVNSCKGQSACKTANNACKGQNSCKGTGFVMKTKHACAAKGGKLSAG